MKWFYVLALLVGGALALSPFWLLHEQKSDPYPGKVVLWDSYESEIKSLDPATCGDTSSAGIQANLFEGLYTYHYLKRPVDVVPLLAEGMPQISEDGLTYTIRIKPGVRYSRNPCFGYEGQGTSRRPRTRTVTAGDFVLALKRCADYHINSGLAWAFLSERVTGLDEWRAKSQKHAIGDFSRYDLPVDGLKAVDDLTLQIKLPERFPQFIYVLAIAVYAPIPREAVDYWLGSEDDGAGGRRQISFDRRSSEFREAMMTVGTGPYVLTTFERKKSIVLERNPEFRGDTYPAEGAPGDKEAGLLDDAGKPCPFIDVLHMDYVAEDYSAWKRFLSKETDANPIPPEVFQFVITPGKDLIEQFRSQRIYLAKYNAPAIYWIVFNVEDPVLSKSRSLRQAMCLCFDVENYIKVLLNGRGAPAVNCIPSSFKGWKEAGPSPYARLDVEEAKKKLDQARQELDAAGVLQNGKFPALKLDMGGMDTFTRRIGEFIQQQFAKIGLKIDVNYNDWPMLQQKVNNKAVQIYTMGWHADYPDAENFLQLFYSPNISKGTNNSNYSRPEFDKLYEQSRVMSDTPRRTDLYVKMIRMIGEDCPVLLLQEQQGYVLYYEWMKNVKQHPFGYGFLKYRRIDDELRKKLGGR